MERLWKITMIAGTTLGTVCFLVMLMYSLNKSVVITEEKDGKGGGNMEPLIQTILEKRQQYEYIVLVNAAHGGENNGNVVDELQEKQITLEVGKKLEKLSKPGEIGFFLIREEDVDISNENRANMIKRIQPDMVIDLHVNADPDNERTFGTAVVYNDAFYRPGMTNVEVADFIEKQVVMAIQGKALGVVADNGQKYPMLSMVQVPAVSVEMGFLTNKQEAELLKKENYQKKIAEGIYKGIQSVREELEKK